MFILEFFQFFGKFCNFIRICHIPLHFLEIKFLPGLFNKCQNFPLLLKILRPDRGCAFEHHMLQEMGGSALPLCLVHGSDTVTDIQRHGRAEFPLQQKDGKPVFQFGPDNTFFQINCLGGTAQGRQ